MSQLISRMCTDTDHKMRIGESSRAIQKQDTNHILAPTICKPQPKTHSSAVLYFLANIRVHECWQ